MELKLSLKESLVLKPFKQIRRQTVDLSGLDRISPAIIYTVFFYKPDDQAVNNESFTQIDQDPFERARSAVQKVLGPWYPAAGRFRINDASGKLEIDCNNQGVIMVTAVTDSKLEELGKLHEYKPCYENLVPKLPDQANSISENPIVVAQITRFACGGFSLGFGSSHALFDGIAAFNFLATWASVCRGKDESELMVPNHSRDRLTLLSCNDSSNPSPSVATQSIYEQDHIAAIQDLYRIPMRAIASDDRCWETALAKLTHMDPQGGIEILTLGMKKEIIEIWKKKVSVSGLLSKCSTFDVLCAHVWKARVKALSLQPNTNICLQFPVNSRSRLQPPLGDNFTGNAFVLASVSCTVKELLEEPLHSTIQKIQGAKNLIKDDYIKLYVKALESPDKFFPSMRELTIVSDWMRFPFEALDFGWGKLSDAAILATPVPETAFLMSNLAEPGGVLVRIGIEKKSLHNLISKFNDISYF